MTSVSYGLGPDEWTCVAEQATKGRPTRNLEQAYRLFREELTPLEQNALTREIAHTRGVELCRAYPNVVLVGYGFRRRHDGDASKVLSEPCVTFVVKRKWAVGDAPPDEEALPGHLLAYWTVDGHRQLCAVPTDVDDGERYSNSKPQSGNSRVKIVDGATGGDANGTLACVIRRSSEPAKIYALSCRHVFSTDNNSPPGARVGHSNTGHLIGTTDSIRGELADTRYYSHDAQLAEVSDVDALATNLGDVNLTGFLQRGEPIPPSFYILTSHGPVVAMYEDTKLNFPIPYDYYGTIIHDEIILSRCFSGFTESGDSGSPLVTEKTGGKLIGMHIGVSNDLPCAIPAWDLLTPENYEGIASGESWSLLNKNQIRLDPPELEITKIPEWLDLHTYRHNFNGGIRWYLSRAGLHIEDEAPVGTLGPPQTVARVWADYREAIIQSANDYAVPVELIISTICTESSGNPSAEREEPGWVSDTETPDRVSAGLMQTLISTAREALHTSTLDRHALFDPTTSINAGTAYIAKQRAKTFFDPPKVACAYNAGGIYANDGSANRWRMRQYPIGTGEHADRFVKWFNDCFRHFEDNPVSDAPSMHQMLKGSL